jgi:predicted Zn-dependent protease
MPLLIMPHALNRRPARIRTSPTRARRLLLLALSACMACAPVVQAQAPASPTSPAPNQSARTPGTLPSLGDGTDMSVSAERRLGDRIAVSIYRDPDVVDDPILSDYMQTIWQPLKAAARSRGELNTELEERFPFEIFLIRDRSVNAFALPGGYFGFNLGLIGTVGTPDELAAVMAHELSHVTQRHISRLMTQQNRQAPWMIAAMILGALAAGKNSNLGGAAIVGGQAVAAQGQINFTRDMEREADRVGYGVMTGAGFDSRGVTGMFEKLQRGASLNDSGAFPYLRSHPLTTERIAEAQSRLQLENRARPNANPGYGQMLHAMMSARARALSAPGVDGLRQMIDEANRVAASGGAPGMVLSAGTGRDAGTLYGGVVAAAKLRDFATSRSLLGKLVPLSTGDERTRNAVQLLSVETDLQAGAVPSSAASFDLGNATSRADVLVNGRALLAARRGQVVVEKLQSWVAANPKDAGAWQLLATAYGNINQPVRAIRADAESRFAQLDYGAALDRMRGAQNMIRATPGSADHVESSIIDTRTRQIDSLLKEQLLQDKIDR